MIAPIAIVSILILNLIAHANAGVITVGACYSACNAGVVLCYSAAGLTFGVSGPVGWWTLITGGGGAAAAACSAAQGVCMAACTTTIIAPTP